MVECALAVGGGPVNRCLFASGARVAAVHCGFAAIQAFRAACQQGPAACDRFMQPLSGVGGPAEELGSFVQSLFQGVEAFLALVGGGSALIGTSFAGVGRVVALVGEFLAVAQYIRRATRAQRLLEVAGRAVLFTSRKRPAWLAGTALLSAAKIVENMELGHNISHRQVPSRGQDRYGRVQSLLPGWRASWTYYCNYRGNARQGSREPPARRNRTGPRRSLRER